MSELRKYTDPSHKLSMRRQCDLLGIHRSSVYYRPCGESAENLRLMLQMDKLFTEDPTLGVLGMQDELKDLGMNYNVKRIRRLLRKMGIEPIYPRKNLSRLGHKKYVHPYLLRNLKITRPNQVWAVDITYVAMKSGFMYLTAIIDVYSRYLVGWHLSNTLDKENQTELLYVAISRHDIPEIINSDQGSQYTCSHWVETLKDLGIQISMDGKGRATDNIYIERWFRTLKQKHIYLNPANSGLDLFRGIDLFIQKYNKRSHQGIVRQKPVDLYLYAA
jgi:putative transposase